MLSNSVIRFTFIFLLILLNIVNINAQIKVAVLNFENTSNIEKYDGFGKAMSNMILTDLKNNIHPRKVSFLERSQLNKILNEQQLQNTKNFDKNTAVTFGKLAGVKYVILGGVYVLDETCNLNSRMVDVESSEIIYAKESNGKISDWLNLKTKLAEELSIELNNPIQVEDSYDDTPINEGTISQYSKAIELSENGEFDKANELLELLKSIQPNFKYYEELQYDLEKLKEQVAKNTSDIAQNTSDIAENTSDIAENTSDVSSLKKSGGLVYELNTIQEYINNMSSNLLTAEEKKDLFIEVVKRFDLSEFNNSNFNVWGFKIVVQMNEEQYLRTLKNDISFIDVLTDRKKEWFIEAVLSDMWYKTTNNSSLKVKIFQTISLLVSKLYKLKKMDQFMSSNYFQYLNFFHFFMRTPDFDDVSFKIYSKHIEKIAIEMKIPFSRLFDNNINLVPENIAKLWMNKEKMDGDGFKLLNAIKFTLLHEIMKKTNPSVLKSSLYVCDQCDGRLPKLQYSLYFDQKLQDEYKDKFDNKYIFYKGGTNSANPWMKNVNPVQNTRFGGLYNLGILIPYNQQ